MSDASPATIAVHHRLDDRVMHAWQRLAEAAPGGGRPASQPLWYRTVLDTVPGAEALIVTRGTRGEVGTVIGCRVARVPVPLRVGYRQLLPVRARTLTVMSGCILGDLGRADELLDTLSAAAAATRASLIALPRLPGDHPLARAAGERPRPWYRTPEPRQIHHWSDLPRGGYDELLADSKSTRKRVRKYQRRLEREHEVVLESYRTPDEVQRFLEAADPIARQSYQRALGADLADQGERARLRRLAQAGWFRGYILRVDGEPWTFDYGMRTGWSFAAMATAYLQSRAEHRPGNIALALWLDELAAEGVREVDWGAGDAPYKRTLSTRSVDEQPVMVMRNDLAGTALALLAGPVDLLDRSARAVVHRLGSTQRLKTAIRSRLRTPSRN
ncbi:MAG: GNAT family N-acetyltransferase [Acidimicrobiales bacterium]